MEKEDKGKIFGIQHFSVHDGPGIRTAVFMKGCNLNCVWCHNPESISPKRELSYVETRCTGCGRCESICPEVHHIERGIHVLSRQDCKACGRCADICCSNALSVIGREMGIEEVMAAILRDKKYYRTSGGGMTITGGEPMCQFAFIKTLLACAKQQCINTVLETNGTASLRKYEEILHYVDLVLFDYKATDDVLHERLTGISNRKIRKNLKQLCRAGADMILRCPVIPGVNDNDEHFKAIAELTKAYGNIRGFEIMPYHKLGISKAKQIGKGEPAEFRTPEQAEVDRWKEKILAYGGKEWMQEAAI